MSGPLDRHIVDQLVIEHLPAALRLAQRLTHDANLAEEIVQEALCRVLGRWKSFRGESSFRTWMLQIVVNVYRDSQRRRRDPQEMLPELCVSQAVEPNEQAVAAETGEMIRAAIDALPDRQREVAQLTFGEGLAASEVATILQTTEGNVYTCIHLARKRIAKVLDVELESSREPGRPQHLEP